VLQVLETPLSASTQALTVVWPELEAEDFAAAPDPPSAQARQPAGPIVHQPARPVTMETVRRLELDGITFRELPTR
jgi:hypothetical protein